MSTSKKISPSPESAATALRIAAARIGNQRIEGEGWKRVATCVRDMGAVQAQDFSMAKWALGLRVPGSTEADVERALARGTIVRTHVLRPTWHFVAAGDLRWMLALAAPRIRTALGSRDRQLGLEPALYRRSRRALEAALTMESALDAAALREVLRDARLPVDENRLSHFLMDAELEALICSGPPRAGRHTYTLLDRHIKPAAAMGAEEAAAELARRYFTTRQPAALEDFAWWSGLPLTVARRAFGSLGNGFRSVEWAGEKLFSRRIPAAVSPGGLTLLPAFDELLIAYQSRSVSLPLTHTRKILSANGIFWPVILRDHQAAGRWSRVAKGEEVTVRAELFGRPDPDFSAAFEKAAARFAAFTGRRLSIGG